MAHNPIREALDKAGALDQRRQAQVARQVEIINRLLPDGHAEEAMTFVRNKIDRAEAFISEHGLWDAYREEVLAADEDTAATD